MDINFSGTFGNYDQNVYDPDTISGGSTLFSINLNNQSANSVTNAITTGNNTVMGSAYNPASSILAEADGTLSLTAVPLPASVWFLVSGLISLFSFKKRQ